MKAGLYITATPIGNLGDITQRALEVLKKADIILAEDTRHTGQLLHHFEIKKPMRSYHKFNEAQRSAELIEAMQQGQIVALVSDAGMPGISDPGHRIVRACHEAGLDVFAIPGASSVTAAMALSGWGEKGFTFAGFVPPKSGRRMKMLEEAAESNRPYIVFESPHRILKLLTAAKECFPERQIFIAREITKLYEENLQGTAEELITHFEVKKPRGEFVVIFQSM